MNQKIDVFLLAAGESSRMFPLSQIMEKSLLPVDGKPVIRHIVDKLKECKQVGGIHICCLDKFSKQFQHEFRDSTIEIIEFEKPEGTYTTWFSALYETDVYNSEWSMVHYADCLTEINYDDFISKIDERFDGVIAVTNTVKHDYSEVIFHPDNKIIGFYEKPQISNYTWSGIGLFNTNNVMEFYNEHDGQDFAFDIFPKMINQYKLKAYPYQGVWYDMGNLNSYRKVCAQYNNGEK
jgi:NDP-sugar pyrophosphorylase family protein